MRQIDYMVKYFTFPPLLIDILIGILEHIFPRRQYHYFSATSIIQIYRGAFFLTSAGSLHLEMIPTRSILCHHAKRNFFFTSLLLITGKRGMMLSHVLIFLLFLSTDLSEKVFLNMPLGTHVRVLYAMVLQLSLRRRTNVAGVMLAGS
jgi:hypothetical protein